MTPLTTLERGAKIRRINTLMSACRLIPNREDILALWDARTYDELTDEEIIQLQGFMELAHRTKTTPAPDNIRRLRPQVLAHMTKIGMYASPEDWQKVNRFLLQKRICGQLLYMLDAGQLQALVRKLRAIGDKKPAMTSRPSVQVTSIYIFPDCGPTVVN